MRIFLRFFGCVVIQVFVALPGLAADRPNILWITSEDNSPYLGCYGDAQAQTPHLDRLALEGFRYRHAFANAPVCSTARTTLIMGMHASTLGAQHHRSSIVIPGHLQQYPLHLRAAGYYCTNNVKEDYNIARKASFWDESSREAHYKNRAPGQPFFAIFNFTTSHESQVSPKGGKMDFRIPPGEIILPPYHPDTPEIRRDWANYYDQMTLMDRQAGKVLGELTAAGLADDTIVFYFADHGGALPRGKRNIHDSGTRVPLIIRIPEKWSHWAPAKPGEWVDDLVSFVDFPATVFSLCGVDIPSYHEGRPFLGPDKAATRDHVYLFRGRMDERHDTVRAIRDREFRYVRNYSPHRPWGQRYSYPFEVQPGMGSWFAEYEAGRCNEAQAAYWQPKPVEELYEIRDDPHEIRNLAGDASHASRITDMRARLRAGILASRDTGFIPEGMFDKLADGMTIYEYAQSDAYPLERILDLADLATSRDEAALSELRQALGDPHPVARYWGAVGCLVLQGKAAPAREQLLAISRDDWGDIRVAAAEALAWMGEPGTAWDTLMRVAGHGNKGEALAALNSMEYLWKAGHASITDMRPALSRLDLPDPADRIVKYLLDQSDP